MRSKARQFHVFGRISIAFDVNGDRDRLDLAQINICPDDGKTALQKDGCGTGRYARPLR
jgi:hypothetical protein